MTRFAEAVMHMECSKAERLLGNGIRYSVVVCVCFCFFFFFFSLRFHNIQNGSRDQDPIGLQRKKNWGCATGILRHFVKGRRDWHFHPRQRKVGVELKRCCNMKRGPRGRRGWNMMGDPNWVAGWRTLMSEMISCPSRLC
jgi:hypothetical protein